MFVPKTSDSRPVSNYPIQSEHELKPLQFQSVDEQGYQPQRSSAAQRVFDGTSVHITSNVLQTQDFTDRVVLEWPVQLLSGTIEELGHEKLFANIEVSNVQARTIT